MLSVSHLIAGLLGFGVGGYVAYHFTNLYAKINTVEADLIATIESHARQIYADVEAKFQKKA